MPWNGAPLKVPSMRYSTAAVSWSANRRVTVIVASGMAAKISVKSRRTSSGPRKMPRGTMSSMPSGRRCAAMAAGSRAAMASK